MGRTRERIQGRDGGYPSQRRIEGPRRKNGTHLDASALPDPAGPRHAHGRLDRLPGDAGKIRIEIGRGHMCPACLATAALITTGATSTGGLMAWIMKTIKRRLK